MLKHLIDLADYLDNKNLVYYATIVDTFIVQAAPMDDLTWQGSDSTYMDDPESSEISPQEEIENKPLTIKLSDNVSMELTSHPLGRQILNFLIKAFQMSDNGLIDDVFIDAKEINNLAKSFSKYDENLNYDANQIDPLEPIQVKNILNQALAATYGLYQSQGSLDKKEILNWINSIYENYEDFFLHKDSPMTPYETSPEMMDLPELSSEERNRLWQQNDQYISNMNTQNWLEETERETNPIRHQQRLNLRRKEDEVEYPEEWHNVLFPQ